MATTIKLPDQLITDNGTLSLDIHSLEIMEPIKLEERLNRIPGVVTAGRFALCPGDVLIMGTPQEVKTIEP